MNRERAEAHLRLVAEAELRRATTPPRDGAAMPAALPGAERRPVVLRRSDVAAALYDLPSRQREALALHGPTGGAEVTVRETGTSPGEHLLHQMATRLLLLALAFPHEIRLHPAVPGPDRFSCVADGLGDVIAALQACGAMSVLSPVPGQLAALCASLDVTGHGITARPAGSCPDRGSACSRTTTAASWSRPWAAMAVPPRPPRFPNWTGSGRQAAAVRSACGASWAAAAPTSLHIDRQNAVVVGHAGRMTEGSTLQDIPVRHLIVNADFESYYYFLSW